jgi:hypothetical protein
MPFALFLSILENALMAIIFQRENVVINLLIKRADYVLLIYSSNAMQRPANKTLTKQRPMKDSLNIRPN